MQNSFSPFLLRIFASIRWKITGEIFYPKGKHVYCQWPLCVMKIVFSRSSLFIRIDQNAELVSNVEKKWQFPALTIMSSILGNGCDSGATILFTSRKSIQSLFRRFDSPLKANVTGAANGELDSSMRLCSYNFVIWNSISSWSGIEHLYGFFYTFLFSINLIEVSWNFTVPTSNLCLTNTSLYLSIRWSTSFFSGLFKCSRLPRNWSFSMYLVTFISLLVWPFFLSSFFPNIISSSLWSTFL